MSYLMKVSPPYIRFETRAMERYKLATEGGELYYIDKDFALVTPHGSKDTVEKELPEWFNHLEGEVRQGRMEREWLAAYRESYRIWKESGEVPVIGTPIKNWPIATPSEVKNLNNVGIRAVEDLANANEEVIARLGMGARGLKQKAVDWVQSNTDQAPLVQQLSALRGVNKGLEHRIGELEAMMAGLGRVQTAPEPVGYHPPVPLDQQLADAQRSIPQGITDEEAVEDVLDSIGKEE